MKFQWAQFRSAAARPIWVPPGSPDGESAWAHAREVSRPHPRPVPGAASSQSRKNRVNFEGCPVPLGRAQQATSKPAVCANQCKKQGVQPIPYIFSIIKGRALCLRKHYGKISPGVCNKLCRCFMPRRIQRTRTTRQRPKRRGHWKSTNLHRTRRASHDLGVAASAVAWQFVRAAANSVLETAVFVVAEIREQRKNVSTLVPYRANHWGMLHFGAICGEFFPTCIATARQGRVSDPLSLFSFLACSPNPNQTQ